jgi:WS/DGAT/MGAT family acyltransferase
LGDNLRRRRQELGRAWSGLTHPARTLRRAQAAWPAWREVFTEQPAPRTSLNHPVGPDRRLATVRGRLDRTKQLAHRHQATVNDVVLAAVATGLRQLLAGRGEPIDRLVLRAMVPISLHHEQPGQARGNQPGWMMVPLPLGEPDPLRRLARIAAETAARTHTARPQTGSGIFRFVAGQRAWYRHFPRQRSVNLVVTNVPGPPTPLYLAGARLLELFPVVPVMGNLTLVVAVLSYAGQLNLTAIADPDGCPDLEVFAQGMRSALDDLTRSVLVPAAEPSGSGAAVRGGRR